MRRGVYPSSEVDRFLPVLVALQMNHATASPSLGALFWWALNYYGLSRSVFRVIYPRPKNCKKGHNCTV